MAFVPGIDSDFFLNPSVAVRHQPFERLLSELTGEKFHPYLSGTLACHLGDVPPLDDLLWFWFPDDIDVEARVQEMFRAVKEVALPWMELHRDLSSFIKDLKDFHFGNPDSKRLRLPLAHFMNGDLETAQSLVTKYLAEIGTDSDPISQRYRMFAENLMARMREERVPG